MISIKTFEEALKLVGELEQLALSAHLTQRRMNKSGKEFAEVLVELLETRRQVYLLSANEDISSDVFADMTGEALVRQLVEVDKSQ